MKSMRHAARWLAAGMILAACTTAPPPPSAAREEGPPPPPPDPPAEFASTHHALLEGVVTSRSGQPLDSVTVVAWRVDGRGMVSNTQVATDAAGRFRLPVTAHVGPEPAFASRLVVRAFGYAARYPRGPGGSVALDSVTVPVTLVPLGQPAPVAQARITLPLP